MEDIDIIEKILEWAEDHLFFDTDFVIQMQERVESGKELTDGQRSALENIVDKFNI